MGSGRIDLFPSQELYCTSQEADIQDFLIFIEFLDGAIVGVPSHAFRLGGKIPFIRVKAANLAQPRLDFLLSSMRSVVPAQEL